MPEFINGAGVRKREAGKEKRRGGEERDRGAKG